MKLTQRKLVSRKHIGALLAVAVIGVSGIAPAYAADGTANGGTNLSLNSSWVNFSIPDSSGQAIFDGNTVVTGSFTNIGNYGGFRVTNPSADLTLDTTTNSFNLGSLGIDMSL